MPPRRSGASVADAIDLTDDPPAPSKASYKTPQKPSSATRAPVRVVPYPNGSSSHRRATANTGTPSHSSPRGQPCSSQPLAQTPSSRSSRATPKTGGDGSEKRVRRFRPTCPQSFHDIYQRATTQRFYVLERYRVGTEECPQEIVDLTGSTGNIYHVHVTKQPKCTCPHAEKGNQCKHMVYVLSKVLNAPFDLVYQLALLSTELQQIFANAPPIKLPSSEIVEDKNRKPVEGDCPICFSELDAKASESVVWCRAACGQNMHRDCFGMWAKSKAGETTCPMCRSVWEGNKDLLNVKKIDRGRGQMEDGYVNIRDQLPGVSGYRDESTYSSWSPYMRGGGQSGYYW